MNYWIRESSSQFYYGWIQVSGQMTKQNFLFFLQVEKKKWNNFAQLLVMLMCRILLQYPINDLHPHITPEDRGRLIATFERRKIFFQLTFCSFTFCVQHFHLLERSCYWKFRCVFLACEKIYHFNLFHKKIRTEHFFRRLFEIDIFRNTLTVPIFYLIFFPSFDFFRRFFWTVFSWIFRTFVCHPW